MNLETAYQKALEEKPGKKVSRDRLAAWAKCTPYRAREFLRNRLNVQTLAAVPKTSKKPPKHKDDIDPEGFLEHDPGQREITLNAINRPYTKQALADIFGVDLEEWECTKFVANHWSTNFQSKAWFAPKFREMNWKAVRKATIELIDEYAPRQFILPKTYSNSKEEHLLEIFIPDFHFDKLCWDEETGELYNMDVAEQRLMQAIEAHLDRMAPIGFSKILFPVGNDFFNTDGIGNATTKGTPQEVSGRWNQTYKRGKELIIKAIDIMAQVAPVEVPIIYGNHDTQRTFYLGDTLNSWYQHNDRVSIDCSPKQRKYIQWGKCLLGLAHGENVKGTTYAQLMAQEVPHLWGMTSRREWHFGHLHHMIRKQGMSTKEYVGVTERTGRSLSATDAWHDKEGYKSLPGSEAFLWHASKGIILTSEFIPE